MRRPETDGNLNRMWYKGRTTCVCHRLDGPAVETSDGHKVWAIQGGAINDDALRIHRLEREAHYMWKKIGELSLLVPLGRQP